MPESSSTTKNVFGNLLREKREQLHLSRGGLAATLGYSRSFVDLLETGRRGCDLEDLPRLAEVLKTDGHELARVYLAERHPVFHRMLYGDGQVTVSSGQDHGQVEDAHWRLERLPRRERGIVEALIYSLDELLLQLQKMKDRPE